MRDNGEKELNFLLNHNINDILQFYLKRPKENRKTH